MPSKAMDSSDAKTTAAPDEPPKIKPICGFERVSELTPELVTKIHESYYKYMKDGYRSWLTFANFLAAAEIWIKGGTYVMLDNYNPGVSLDIHIGVFKGATGRELLDKEGKKFLRDIMRLYGVVALRAFTPENAAPMLKLLDRYGFKRTGIIPLDGYWDGKLGSVYVSILTSPQLEDDSQ